MSRPTGVAFGDCWCGCGLKAPIAKATSRRRGWTKGQPVRFLSGHNSRVRPRQDLAERFWLQVDKDGPTVRPELGPCWLWTGSRDEDGYGRINVDGETVGAHRVALELAGYIIPAEFLQVLHRCDNPPCVRPDHLRIGTKHDDAADKVSKGRQPRGERHWKAKLTDTLATEIRSLYQAGGTTQEELAQQFGVDETTIANILRGNAWTHLLADKTLKNHLARGERHGSAKLAQVSVDEIRALYQRGVRGRGYQALAKRFGVNESTIRDIISGKNWKPPGPSQ
jgi:DNA-binding XRE family transcriptional regulator